MNIRYLHSHLNGHEFLLVHRPEIWETIVRVIESINANNYMTKESKERGMVGRLLYSPVEINNAFREAFYDLGWEGKIQRYFLTPNQELAYMTMALPPDEQRQIILEHGERPYHSSNQTDFLNNRIAVEIQFGKYAFVAYDLFVKHMAFYIANKIDVGIEIIPTKAMCEQMSSGIAYYESEVYNVYRQGRSTPAVPLVMIGIEP